MPGNEKGATAVLVTFCIVVICTCAAIAIDIGMLLNSQAEAQRTADAAALAGASAFMPPPVPFVQQPDSARSRAHAYVEINPVLGVPVPPENVDVRVIPESLTVRVTVRRHGLRTWFSGLFAGETLAVSARAAAWAATSGRAGCLKPFIIADGWDDRDRDGKWSPGDAYDPATTGWGSRFRNGDGTGYHNDVGRPVALKRGQFDVAIQTGWYQLIRLDGSSGGSDVRQQIRSTICNPTILEVNDYVPPEGGATVGPVLQGVADLIALDPHARWENGRIVGSAYGHNGDGATSPRIINVPLMDPSQLIRQSQREIQVTNFAALFLETVDQTGAESSRAVHGRWLTLRGIPDNCRERGTCRPTLLYLRLIE